jgi:hypothetical protein
MSDIYKVSDGTRVVGKCLKNILIPCFGAGRVWGWRNIPRTVRVFSCARNIPYKLAYKSVFWELNFGPKVYVRLIGTI